MPSIFPALEHSNTLSPRLSLRQPVGRPERRLPNQSPQMGFAPGKDIELGRFPQGIYFFFGNQLVRPDCLDLAARFDEVALDLPLQFLHPIPFSF